MTQLTFSDVEYAGKRKQARREVFLAQMERAPPPPPPPPENRANVK
ncbi:hypothetical protein XACN24_07045 [Xanthomonas albilineans]